MYFVITPPKSGTHLLRHILGMKGAESIISGMFVGAKDGGEFFVKGRLYTTGIAGHWMPYPPLMRFSETVPSFTLLRDPRDIIVSHYHFVDKIKRHQQLASDKFTGMVYEDYSGSARKDALIDTLHRHMEEFLPWLNTGIVVTRYEDILDNPEEALVPVAEASGVDLDVLVERSRFRGGNTFRKGVAGEWKHEFTDGQKKRINELYGHIMEAWGYD